MTCEWSGLKDECPNERRFLALADDLDISMCVCRDHIAPCLAWMLGSVPIEVVKVTLVA